MIEPLESNEKYMRVVLAARKLHKQLLDMYNDDNYKQDRENPALIGDLLMKLRLNANWLFSFINDHYDDLNERLQAVAKEREGIYTKLRKEGQTPNASKMAAGESTRVKESEIEVLKNQIAQMKGEYERYNGICSGLQSRLREFNTERMTG